MSDEEMFRMDEQLTFDGEKKEKKRKKKRRRKKNMDKEYFCSFFVLFCFDFHFFLKMRVCVMTIVGLARQYVKMFNVTIFLDIINFIHMSNFAQCYH